MYNIVKIHVIGVFKQPESGRIDRARMHFGWKYTLPSARRDLPTRENRFFDSIFRRVTPQNE